MLKAAARQRLHAGQDTLDFGDGRPAGEALPITATQSKRRWDALCWVYDRLGLDAAAGGDEVFRLLDTWLRTSFVPALEDNVRVVLIGRDPPAPAWLTTPRWPAPGATSPIRVHVSIGPMRLSSGCPSRSTASS